MKYGRIFVFALNQKRYEQQHRAMHPEVEGGAVALAEKYGKRGQQVQLCWCNASGTVENTEGELSFTAQGQKLGIYIVCEADTTTTVATDAFVKEMIATVKKKAHGDSAVWRYLCLVACVAYNKKNQHGSPIALLAKHLHNNNKTPDLAAFDAPVSIMFEGMQTGSLAANFKSAEALKSGSGRKIEVGSGGAWVTRSSRGESKAKHKFKWSLQGNQYVEASRSNHNLDLDQIVIDTDQDMDPFALVIAPIILQPQRPRWVPDSERARCNNCLADFTFFRRRHHCRGCGEIFCDDCTSKTKQLQRPARRSADSNENGPYRVCDNCHGNGNL